MHVCPCQGQEVKESTVDSGRSVPYTILSTLPTWFHLNLIILQAKSVTILILKKRDVKVREVG